MSLQRRLLLYLLICAPLVWTIGMLVSVSRARHEVNELYDSEMIRLARQVQAHARALLPPGSAPVRGLRCRKATSAPPTSTTSPLRSGTPPARCSSSIATETGPAVRRAGANGFIDDQIGSDRWRVYYLHRQVANGSSRRARSPMNATRSSTA